MFSNRNRIKSEGCGVVPGLFSKIHSFTNQWTIHPSIRSIYSHPFTRPLLCYYDNIYVFLIRSIIEMRHHRGHTIHIIHFNFVFWLFIHITPQSHIPHVLVEYLNGIYLCCRGINRILFTVSEKKFHNIYQLPILKHQNVWFMPSLWHTHTHTLSLKGNSKLQAYNQLLCCQHFQSASEWTQGNNKKVERINNMKQIERRVYLSYWSPSASPVSSSSYSYNK